MSRYYQQKILFWFVSIPEYRGENFVTISTDSGDVEQHTILLYNTTSYLRRGQ